MKAPGKLCIWLITDGKPGHENQSRGLTEALGRQVPTEVWLVPAQPATHAITDVLFRRAEWAATLPDPDLIMGAGHATHLTLLAARRARGGRAIVMMKPSLPCGLFDLCVIPSHDDVAASDRIWVTEGALNRIHRESAAAFPARQASGLILIGGPSPHFEWDMSAILRQLREILESGTSTHWTLTTSRRTPSDFAERLAEARHPNLTVTPHTGADANWLPARLLENGQVWVTPDSASMVYEALTAGADVGLFDLPPQPNSRVVKAIDRLVEQRRVTPFSSWLARRELIPNTHPLNEAERCAEWIIKWLKNAS